MENEVKDFLRKEPKEEDNVGHVGNDILYEMCKKYPNHNDVSEIIAKVWLIGRSYAVSIERNRNNRSVSDNFYSDIVAPAFKSDFDNLLVELKKIKELKKENIKVILKTHKNIVDFINKKITKDNKRSFVSKYLHFHFPNLFFIYDKRVNGEINKVFKEIGKSKRDVINILSGLIVDEYDENYAEFFVKCFYLLEFCRESGINLSARQIDSFLIQKANKKIQKFKDEK